MGPPTMDRCQEIQPHLSTTRQNEMRNPATRDDQDPTQTFHGFQTPQTQPKKLERKPTRRWLPFSVLKVREALTSTPGKSAPGPDHIMWRYIKLAFQHHS